jgi:TonB family protein
MAAAALAYLLLGQNCGAALSHGVRGGGGLRSGNGGGGYPAAYNNGLQTANNAGPSGKNKEVKPPPPLAIHDKWAVVVGVGRYQDPAVKLIKYATRNVLTLTETLCDPQVGHFLPDHVLVATEEKVTRDALADSTWQGWLSKKALPNDMIVLYFCMRYVPTDDASDLLLLSQESKLAQKEMTATSLASLLGEIRRRTQCKNIVALLDISPTEQTAKNYPYGFGTLLQSIGQKSGVTIFAADDRLLGSLDDDGPARASVFVEYFCQALKAGGGTLALDYMASYVSQILAQQAPAKAGGYNSHPILLPSTENPEMVKTAVGMPVKNPNAMANIKIGRPISQIALTDPALAAHLEALSQINPPLQQLHDLKKASDQAEAEREEEEEEAAAAGQDVDFAPYMATMKKTIQGKWTPPKGLEQKTVVAVFSIQKDGSIIEPEIVESSGSQQIDQSALKALSDASPLAPLPKGAPKRVQIRYKFDWKVTK